MTEYHEQVHETELRATPEQVWAMLTEPERMKTWYIDSASVDPREGGEYRVDWGGGMVGRARIDVWDPPRRLRLVPQEQGPVEEFTTEVKGERTLLRLTFSIPDGDSWEEFYDGTNLGWKVCFSLMGTVLERHAGRSVIKAGTLATSPHAPSELYERARRLIGEVPTEGRFELTTALGDRWSGEVLLAVPPSGRFGNWALSLRVETLGDAVFHVAAEQHGGRSIVYGGIWFYGDADETVGKAYRDLLIERLDLTEM